MDRSLRCAAVLTSWRAGIACLLCMVSLAGTAAPQQLGGSWYATPPGWQPASRNDPSAGLTRVERVAKTGGHYVFVGELDLSDATPRVIDFKNSSVIGDFRHRVFDGAGTLVYDASGGINSQNVNTFPLRHGRALTLPAGHYRLVSTVSAPFFLAQPQPYLDDEADYRHAIRGGNAITLLCLGVLVGLGFFYAVLSLIRRELTDALYSAFILGNLLYNGMALLVIPEFLDCHWFYLISVPILFSNCVYVLFVFRLLDISLSQQLVLFSAGSVLLVVLTAFIAFASSQPNWSLEMDRIGVALFMTFGLACGIVQARNGLRVARYYLVAVISFFVLGGVAISLSEIDGLYTYYVEHLGLLAVTTEALLLALVVASQFAQMRNDFQRERQFAQLDDLTGLRNRRAFLQAAEVEVERAQRYARPLALIYIDLDNFKQLNDTRGHTTGDTALSALADVMADSLRSSDVLGRLGGDEFAIVLTEIDFAAAERAAQKVFSRAREALQEFPPVTVSMGVTWFDYVDRSLVDMMQVADELMYQAKDQGKDNLRIRRVDADLDGAVSLQT